LKAYTLITLYKTALHRIGRRIFATQKIVQTHLLSKCLDFGATYSGKFSAITPKLFAGTPSALSSSTKLWRQIFKIPYHSRDIQQKLFFNWPIFSTCRWYPAPGL